MIVNTYRTARGVNGTRRVMESVSAPATVQRKSARRTTETAARRMARFRRIRGGHAPVSLHSIFNYQSAMVFEAIIETILSRSC
jgi:hypothetical protein